MEIISEEIGKRILDIRKNQGLSMEKFAVLTGANSKGTVNNWEKGLYIPNLSSLEKIAILGHISLDELKFGSLNVVIDKLFSTIIDIEIPKQFYSDLELSLLEKKITQTQIAEIMLLAVKIKPEFMKSNDFNKVCFQNGLTKEFLTSYEIESSINFRKYTLPILDDLFSSNNSEANKKITGYLLSFLIAKDRYERAVDSIDNVHTQVIEEFQEDVSKYKNNFLDLFSDYSKKF